MIGYHRSRPVSAHPQLNTRNGLLVWYKRVSYVGLSKFYVASPRWSS
jgi:hypothetical protein